MLVVATKIEERLKQLGFTFEELESLESKGFPASDVLSVVDGLMEQGYTTEEYARATFEEAYPEYFTTEIAETPPLKYGKDDRVKNEISNFVAIMEGDKHYAGIRYNELSTRAEVHRTINGQLTISAWSDADEAQSMMYIESKYGLYSKDKHTAALRILFNERAYNPVKDIIDAVEWDGEERCVHFLSKWMLVEDSPYTREVSRLIFAGGINRLYRPGCKFEDVPIFMGAGGSGKSYITHLLAINDDYHGDLKVMEGQQAIENLQGKWIMEIPEMSAFTRAKDQEAVKAFISRQRDQYRKPYDRNTTELPRRCIFIASTNDFNPLVDKTGNRRWYPVEVHSDGYDLFDHEEELREYILQCWAEAREKLNTKAMQPFADKSLLKVYREVQDNAMQDDWRVGAIKLFLDKKLPGEITCVREVCHRALSPNPDMPKEPSLVESKDIGKILNTFDDWERVGNKRIGFYGVQKCWQKKGDPNAVEEKQFWEE